MSSSNSPPAPRWLAGLLIALTIIVLTGLFSTELADSDAWWHLATGRYMVTHHRLPVPDPFTYTTAAAPEGYPGESVTRYFNLTHEWLAQAVMYLIERTAGVGAVVLWKGLLLALLCMLTGHAARLRTNSALWGIAAALAAASLAVEFAHDRPSILSFVFTALFLVIFEERRGLWLLPPLALVWANCHGGFFLGWVVCGAYGLEALVTRAPDRKRILLAGSLAFVASGLNPNGFNVVSTLLRYRRSALTASLTEWLRPGLWGPPYAFDLLLYAAVLAVMLAWRRVRIADWVLLAAFGAAALSAFRNEMLIGVLAPIVVASYFPWKKRLPWVVPYAVAAVLAGAIVWNAARGTSFQLRAAEWRFPSGAAQFLRDHSIAAPLFNTYEYGGYLIWRGLPVFIDGRALSETVFQQYRLILATPPGDPRRAETLGRYGIGTMLLNGFEYNSGVLYPLLLHLARPDETEWNLVYDDPEALVFVRDLPPGVAALDKRRIYDHLDAECRLHVDFDPEFSLCARTLADLYMKSGSRDRARHMLELYLAHPYADDPGARQAYLQLLRP